MQGYRVDSRFWWGGKSNRPPIPRNSLFTKGTVSRNVLSLQNGKVGGKGISGVPNGTPPLAVALGELIKADSHRASNKNMDVANSSRVLKLKQSLVDFVAMLKEIGGWYFRGFSYFKFKISLASWGSDSKW